VWTGGASADETLDACVAVAVRALESSGATLRGEPSVGFLREGGTRAVPFRLEREECIGFLAVGHARVHDLDLTLYTESGIVLEQDNQLDARPWVRFCGARGLSLVAAVQMYKGQGEFALMTFGNAPAVPPDLNRTVGECFATSGGMHRPPADVGGAPPGRSIDEGLWAVGGALAELGYARDGEEQRGQLGEGARETRELRLDRGKCWAVVAVGDEGVADVDLVLRSTEGRELARDFDRTAHAVVKTCADHTDYVAEVRMYAGRGAYALVRFRLDETSAPPAHADGSARLGWAELGRRLSRHAMEPAPVGWGMAIPGQPLSMPIELEGGRCHAVAAIATNDARSGDLDLLLLDENDRLVAWDLGRDASPVVWHCPAVGGTFRAVSRIYGAWGRYLLVLGRER
jgi:hypothetical protein